MSNVLLTKDSPEHDTAKYRPILSAREIETLIVALLQQGITNHHRGQLLTKLQVFQAKIRLGATKPAYKEKDWLNELGASEFVSLEERRLQAYKRFTSSDPTSCNAEDIKQAQTYRYENNLMSESERIEFEAQLFNEGI
jgi:hypothetical protein